MHAKGYKNVSRFCIRSMLMVWAWLSCSPILVLPVSRFNICWYSRGFQTSSRSQGSVQGGQGKEDYAGLNKEKVCTHNPFNH